MRKKILLFILSAVMLAACDNQNSVNILISNSSAQPLENREVTIALDTIRQWLDISISDTLILLNEKNQPLPYTYSKDRSSISFRVPSIQQRSQKNFSINKSDTQLRQNLFAFRRRNIEVRLK